MQIDEKIDTKEDKIQIERIIDISIEKDIQTEITFISKKILQFDISIKVSPLYIRVKRALAYTKTCKSAIRE